MLSREIPTYNEDGRIPLHELYITYDRLLQSGWKKEVIYTQHLELPIGQFDLPILGFTSPKQGSAFWNIFGIHGEEPAGPNAVAEKIDKIIQLGEKYPVVFLPLCNPLGYAKNFRYPYEYRDHTKGKSVGDSLLFLHPNVTDNSMIGPEAQTLTRWVIKTTAEYRPLLVIDHHEDEALSQSYIYCIGEVHEGREMAQKILFLMEHAGISIQHEGTTRFGEIITEGVIWNEKDDSIDELLCADSIFINGHMQPGPAARTSFVIETPVINTPLSLRKAAHGAIIDRYEELFHLAQNN